MAAFRITKSPTRVAAQVLDKALPTCPSTSPNAIAQLYERIADDWSSRELFRGSRDEIGQLLLSNLERIASTSGFKNFQAQVGRMEFEGEEVGWVDVKALLGERAIALVGGRVIWMRLWRSDQDCFVCGNSDFRQGEHTSSSNSEEEEEELVAELIEIEVSVGFLCVGDHVKGFTNGRNRRTQTIGRRLYELGGHDLMLDAWRRVQAAFNPELSSAARHLDVAWDDIGDWKG